MSELTTSRSEVIIRDATDADAVVLLEIHNDAIANSVAIWTDNPTSLAERQSWLADQVGRGYPVIVAEIGGVVVGYATFGPWRPKRGYRYTVDDSVYVRAGQRGAGVGRRLLTALIDRARQLGYHVMIADIEAGNEVSIELHRQLGFEHCGTIREVGTKFDRWLDLTVMRLQLS